MQCYNRQTVLERTISEAASLNCPADDGLEAMVDCLRTVHPDDLFDSGISPPDDPIYRDRLRDAVRRSYARDRLHGR